MICFGAVMLNDTQQTFRSGVITPLAGAGFNVQAMAVTGTTEAGMKQLGRGALFVMTDFRDWLADVNGPGRPQFYSDNNGFDWQFINYYFHLTLGENPFGFSSQNIGSLYKGMVKDMRQNFRHLRKTPHTHDPVDDAMGNTEALIHMRDKMGLKI